MREIKIENSMKDLSIVDLFDSIDNVENNNDTNDEIIETVKDKIYTLLNSFLQKKKEKERKEAMLRRYKAYLDAFQNLIEKQMTTINNLLEEDTYDISDKFLNIKKELIEYSMQIYKLDLQDMSEVLNQKEKKIYTYIHVYDFLDKYNRDLKISSLFSDEYKNSVEKGENNEKKNVVSSNWKKYYYLVICLEKQEKYNMELISYLKKDYDEHFLKLSNFYAADFQGQLSKNIYCQRKKLKLTQMQLSERSGVDRTMIAKIEKVKQPTTLETAIKLLSSLNMGIAIYPFTELVEKSEY